MKIEIPENVAKAINTIRSFCGDGLYKNCDGCPFCIPNDTFCLFTKVYPAYWNVNEEKHYYIEYNRK